MALLFLGLGGWLACHQCEGPDTGLGGQEIEMTRAEFDAAVGDGEVADACDGLCASVDEEIARCSAEAVDAERYQITCEYSVTTYCD